MRLKAWYNGYEITQYCDIRSIRPLLSAPRSNTFISNSNNNGSHFRGTKLGQLAIGIDITIKYDVMENIDALNRILNSNEPKPLMISDRTDRYLMAIIDGEIGFSSRFIGADATLNFISPDHYWHSTEGIIKQAFNEAGRAVVVNNGTMPTPPTIDVTFTNDCGYLGIISPDGYVDIGNVTEPDGIDVPPTEYAMNEEMHDLKGWQRVTNAEEWIPDYVKISSEGAAKTDDWGMLLDTSTLGNTDKWHGHAYVKDFEKGAAEIEADNFEFRSRFNAFDKSGRTDRTFATLMVIMDEDNNPIMTTSMYDVTGDRNRIEATFKIRDGESNRSRIIASGNLNEMNGFVRMSKRGNKFDWLINHNGTEGDRAKAINTGDTVYIKDSARTYYHSAGYPVTIPSFVRNRPHKASGQRWVDGWKQIRITYQGVEIAWIREVDLRTNQVIKVGTQPKQLRLGLVDNNLAQLRPYKVFLWQAKWGATQPYTDFDITSSVVKRFYTTDKLELINTFMAGDHLHVNNKDQLVLLNGETFGGLVDFDSRPFSIPPGNTEIALQPSSWADMPQATVSYERRWS